MHTTRLINSLFTRLIPGTIIFQPQTHHVFWPLEQFLSCHYHNNWGSVGQVLRQNCSSSSSLRAEKYWRWRLLRYNLRSSVTRNMWLIVVFGKHRPTGYNKYGVNRYDETAGKCECCWGCWAQLLNAFMLLCWQILTGFWHEDIRTHPQKHSTSHFYFV